MRLVDSNIIIYATAPENEWLRTWCRTVCSLADLPDRSARLSSNNTRSMLSSRYRANSLWARIEDFGYGKVTILREEFRDSIRRDPSTA
jgi:hypothetical protein